jgi:hypothetical protein
LAAVGAGFVAISISTYGADLGTRYSTTLVVPSHRAPAGGRPTPVYPINPPDAKQDRSMQRTRIVGQRAHPPRRTFDFFSLTRARETKNSPRFFVSSITDRSVPAVRRRQRSS